MVPKRNINPSGQSNVTRISMIHFCYVFRCAELLCSIELDEKDGRQNDTNVMTPAKPRSNRFSDQTPVRGSGLNESSFDIKTRPLSTVGDDVDNQSVLGEVEPVRSGLVREPMEDSVLLAKTYMDLREYRRAAYFLEDARSNISIFMRCYCLYMVGFVLCFAVAVLTPLRLARRTKKSL